MENFFNYLTRPVSGDDVDTWFRANNILPEKMELFSDFSISLYGLMVTTYLGMDNDANETKINITDDDNENHFQWCWNKTIENFKRENINFEISGEHYTYYLNFFKDVFYNEKQVQMKESIGEFFKELFDVNIPFTKSDLDMILGIYRLMEKGLKK